ncbi:uncharacterized protein LOC133758801 [Lepus europaeus]|uniref:uncharacterized protein LOC133758801 n=1 Tax=Lepus europaeus TaxID=9983 RepID=UPI002B47795E|nr:uncharacterized protein LOC133758801 [Lepus europaeus]
MVLPPGALQGASSLPEAHTRRFLPGASGRRPAGGCGLGARARSPPAPGSPRSGGPAAKEGAAGGRGRESAARRGETRTGRLRGRWQAQSLPPHPGGRRRPRLPTAFAFPPTSFPDPLLEIRQQLPARNLKPQLPSTASEPARSSPVFDLVNPLLQESPSPHGLSPEHLQRLKPGPNTWLPCPGCSSREPGWKQISWDSVSSHMGCRRRQRRPLYKSTSTRVSGEVQLLEIPTSRIAPRDA